MFAYPLPSIPTHFQPILIENQSSPIGIDPTTLKTNFPSADRGGGQPKSDLLSPINEQHPYARLGSHNGISLPTYDTCPICWDMYHMSG